MAILETDNSGLEGVSLAAGCDPLSSAEFSEAELFGLLAAFPPSLGRVHPASIKDTQRINNAFRKRACKFFKINSSFIFGGCKIGGL